MGYRKIIIDPVTRIEGHLKIETEIENNVVVDARASADMFRGIEKALIGYDARVAQQVTQRVCGICPYGHAEAASLALESAMGIKPNKNGQLLRNMIVGAYQLSDHLLHFYHLCALDFIDITAALRYTGKDPVLSYVKEWVQSELKNNKVFPAAPFLPRYEGRYTKSDELSLVGIKSYVEALPLMAEIHKMVAIFGAKAPHPVAMEAGGVTTKPTSDKLAKYWSLLEKAESFITNNYYNDVAAVARRFRAYFKIGRGTQNLLSYPSLPDAGGQNHLFQPGATINGRYEPLKISNILEDHAYSYYKTSPSSGVKPLSLNELTPLSLREFENEHGKSDGKYSWQKAPRYKGQAMEVGPAARVVNTYHSGRNTRLNRLVDAVNKTLGIGLKDYDSVMGRHLSRMLISQIIVEKLKEDVNLVEAEKSAFVEVDVPKNSVGVGLTEASRGALGHWIQTDSKGYIKNYDMIVPTTWNMSPRDAAGRRGAVEEMLVGTAVINPDHPLELLRVIRSVDPCIACSVH